MPMGTSRGVRASSAPRAIVSYLPWKWKGHEFSYKELHRFAARTCGIYPLIHPTQMTTGSTRTRATLTGMSHKPLNHLASIFQYDRIINAARI